jgi:hypothetical protein
MPALPAVSRSPGPPERELAVEIPGGGRRGQYGAVDVVELVPKRRGDDHDGGDQERGPPGRDLHICLEILPVERIGHVAADAGVEEPGLPGRERDLAGGAGPGQPGRQHRQPVLPEAIPVEAAGQAVGEPWVVDLAVHDGVGVQAHGGGGGRHARQALYLPMTGSTGPGTLTNTSLELIAYR